MYELCIYLWDILYAIATDPGTIYRYGIGIQVFYENPGFYKVDQKVVFTKNTSL
jgi:hypothetical protein